MADHHLNARGHVSTGQGDPLPVMSVEEQQGAAGRDTIGADQRPKT